MTNLRTIALRPYTRLITMITARPARTDSTGGRGNWAGERGDVPGWVMITMMTAIVVIALIGVFRDAVVNAVQNAFSSISG